MSPIDENNINLNHLDILNEVSNETNKWIESILEGYQKIDKFKNDIKSISLGVKFSHDTDNQNNASYLHALSKFIDINTFNNDIIDWLFVNDIAFKINKVEFYANVGNNLNSFKRMYAYFVSFNNIENAVAFKLKWMS